MQTILFRQFQNLDTGRCLVQETILHRLHTHDDVIQNTEALDQLEVLVDHADAQIVCVVRIINLDFLAVLLNNAFLRCIQTEQHTHQSGFTCTVFAKQCVDLTLLQLERDIIVCNNTREFFGDV